MAEEYVGVWWNGLRLPATARRIYYLITEHGHTVRAEAGTDERKVRVWDLPDEAMARARIQDLMEPEDGGSAGAGVAGDDVDVPGPVGEPHLASATSAPIMPVMCSCGDFDA